MKPLEVRCTDCGWSTRWYTLAFARISKRKHRENSPTCKKKITITRLEHDG